MKKIKFLTIALLAMTVQTVFAQNNRIIRRHNGEVTLYTPSNLSQAIKDCEDGDTISLGKGVYGGFTIAKKITVIGNGVENTKISGNVTLSSSTSSTWMSFTDTVLDGLFIDGYISLGHVNNVKIRKCQFSYFHASNDNSIVLENCYITNYFASNSSGTSIKITNLTAINSKIKSLNASIGNGYLLNCFVNSVSTNYDGYMENCVIGNTSNSYSKGNYTNCLFLCDSKYISSLITTDCYFNNELKASKITDEDLKNLTYMGTDGTMVGPFGGIMPYSLEKLNPITSVNLKVDDANQKLNVTVKLADK